LILSIKNIIATHAEGPELEISSKMVGLIAKLLSRGKFQIMTQYLELLQDFVNTDRHWY
jgi:hypothetical protein